MNPPRGTSLTTDSVASAKVAGLRFVRDDRPGISRRRRGKRFHYVAEDGSPVKDEATLARIAALAIPPAWREVWVCPLPHGHLQATGRDERGRKQYRYHRRWHAVRDETKYDRVIAFGLALPSLRARVEADLSQPGLRRAKVLATVVRLLETTLIRVGNEEYAKANGSFGLTTLRNRHVEVTGASMQFTFKGKSGVRHRIDVRDQRLARVVARCRDLPGQRLFQYVEVDGETRGVDSDDVNAYLREAAGEEFTAKDFRTWAGTVLMARTLGAFEVYDSPEVAKRNIVTAIEAVAKQLGNTTAVCRKCYVHPTVLAAYLEGGLTESLRQGPVLDQTAEPQGLNPEEAAVLTLLQQRQGRETG